MSDINSFENTRSVAVEARTRSANPAVEQANSGRDGGKGLPVQEKQATPPQQASQPETQQRRSARVEQAVEQLNEYVQSLQRDLQFSLDEELGRAVVRVIDSSTQEVIRQIPNETALQLARNLKADLETGRVDRAASELRVQNADPVAAGGVDARLGLINTRV
ncbi:MAG: flagellar protein FlaG [Pseudomonadota bacterium]